MTVGLVLAAWLIVGLAVGIIVGKTIRYGRGPDDG